LPVDLTDFSAKAFTNSVQLRWSTVSEINNSYFEIERSTDGEIWISLGQVAGAGNSDELNTYAFADMNPESGINYYRLKQADFNGDVHYSELIEVILNIVKPDQVKLYPIPAVNIVNIDVPSTVETVKTEIRTLDGRIIKSEIFNNMNNVAVSVQDLLPGMYYIHIQTGNQTIVKTMFKQ
jgi:hypothetical protein